FSCNAVAISTGASVVFGSPGLRGVPLVDGVYASCTLPGVFEPLSIGGERYFDGGIVDSCPIRIARARGATRIVAVDLSVKTQRRQALYRPSLPFLMVRAFEILEANLVEEFLHRTVRDDVVLIQPDVVDHGRFEFRDLPGVVEKGERAAAEALATPEARKLFGLDRPEAAVRAAFLDRFAPRGHVRPRLDVARCVACGACVEVCPTGAYDKNGQPLPFVAKPIHVECRRDGACERHCPTGAIRLDGL
ncbi:MAG TPA: patatin-like phospholipase family protein, partial [Planctomycetota bacterium]|nr:patatin-like phospholipase family protein [Planctomycetota bacterium]